MTITERIYKALWEVQHKKGMAPKAIYLGQGFRSEYDRIINSLYLNAEIPTDRFADVPLFWVVSPADHFYIAGEFKK